MTNTIVKTTIDGWVAKSMGAFKTLKDNSSPGALNIIIFIIVAAFAMYVYINIKKEGNNCKKISKGVMNTTILSIDNSLNPIHNDISNTPLNKTFIKTAYNCCCTGKYKNDFVSYCALINCARQGVRALDFTVYSLKGSPVIGASTIKSNEYKETYNSLPFANTMSQVYQYFIASTMNCNNASDPLFLIFRIQSLLRNTYDEMATVLNATFGAQSLYGNMIYYIRRDLDVPLDSVLLKQLVGKVVIIIDITGVQKDVYSKSKLSIMSALTVGNGINILYRDSDLLQHEEEDDVLDNSPRSLSILYPDYSNHSNNYDFRPGLKQNTNFIGLSFQTDDNYLKNYNDLFKKSAFVDVSDAKVQSLIK